MDFELQELQCPSQGGGYALESRPRHLGMKAKANKMHPTGLKTEDLV